jgi:hypothetical protein
MCDTPAGEPHGWPSALQDLTEQAGWLAVRIAAPDPSKHGAVQRYGAQKQPSLAAGCISRRLAMIKKNGVIVHHAAARAARHPLTTITRLTFRR